MAEERCLATNTKKDGGEARTTEGRKEKPVHW